MPFAVRQEWRRLGATDLASKIIASCEAVFYANRTDAIGFLRAVASQYFSDLQFIGPSADATIGALATPGSGWLCLETDAEKAINAALSGRFVIGCMHGDEFSPVRPDGHVAIIVGLKGEKSNKTVVPICYAGALRGPTAYGRRVSMTFPAADAQFHRIRYFAKEPDQAPYEHAFEIILATLRQTRTPQFKNPKLRYRQGLNSRQI